MENSGELEPQENKSKKNNWIESIHRFNDNISQLVSFNSKLLIFIMLLFFVYLILASVFQGESFSISKLNVHSTLEAKGYNNGFIAKKISYNVASMVNVVPEKLLAMFSSGEDDKKKEILYNRILSKYEKKEIKVDFNVDVGGVSLPLHDLIKTARSLFNVEDKSLDGDITVEDDMIIMTLGFSSNGVNKSYMTKRYNYVPKDSVKMIDVIDSMTLDAAKYILKQYDPIVTILNDFIPPDDYHPVRWQGGEEEEKKAIEELHKMYLNESKDKELAIWARAITGKICADKSKDDEKNNDLAIQHFEKAIEMDPSFIDIVGVDLVNRLSDNEDSTSQNKIISTYRKMVNSNPRDFGTYYYLFTHYSEQNDSNTYFLLLENAFKAGYYIPQENMGQGQYAKFKNQSRFKSLVKKYNEKNKPIF
jgi:tetratricopeptide (TPR) repeat protein